MVIIIINEVISMVTHKADILNCEAGKARETAVRGGLLRSPGSVRQQDLRMEREQAAGPSGRAGPGQQYSSTLCPGA